MDDFSRHEICGRISHLRMEVTGPRGKSAFARMLGLPASTYDYYESGRVPPAEILVKIAEVAQVNICWLLTGQIHCEERIGAASPILQRAARLLKDSPQAAGALSALLDILEQTGKFPRKPGLAPTDEAVVEKATGLAAGSRPQKSALSPAGHSQLVAADTGLPPGNREQWIPVLGRTAAGVPQFWTGEDGWDVPTLDQVLARHGRDAATLVSSAVAELAESGRDDAQLITLTQPDASDLAQFVVAGNLKERYPDAFALRVDGDSMSPEIRHGDLVVLSPSAPAQDGRAAVVQIDRQIGVTCKLLRREGDRTHLIGLAESVPPVSVDSGKVSWALRVLARIRG